MVLALLAAACSGAQVLPGGGLPPGMWPRYLSDPSGWVVAPGRDKPDLGTDYYFGLAAADAARECSESAARNLRELGIHYKGVLELAPPDQSLICLANRASKMLEARDVRRPTFNEILEGKPAVRPMPDEWAQLPALAFFRSPLAEQVEQLDSGARSHVGRIKDADTRLAELRPIGVARTSLATKLLSMMDQLRAGQAAPRAAELAEFLWPHQACVAAARRRSDDFDAASARFVQRRAAALVAKPIIVSYAFYGDYLALVEGFARYKDPAWSHTMDEAMARYGLGTACGGSSAAALMLPFFVEVRPPPPARGRRPLDAFRDIEGTATAITALGDAVDAEIARVTASRAGSVRQLQDQATSLLVSVKASIATAQATYDGLIAGRQVDTAAMQRVRDLVAHLEQQETAYRETAEKQAQLKASIEVLKADVATKQRARTDKRAALTQAETARRAVKLQCNGRDYANCQDLSAKSAFDQALYEASGAYLNALTVLQQADSELEQSQARLDKARDEQLAFPQQLSALRAQIHGIREALDREAAAPPVDAHERTSSLTRAAVELDDWKKLLARVEAALVFAAQASTKP